MAFSTQDFLVQVDSLISADEDELNTLARTLQIEAAIERYNHDLPD